VHSEENFSDRDKDLFLWRGQLVVDLLSCRMDLPTVHVMDLGCGFGGVSLALARTGARVTAVDANPARIRHLQDSVEKLKLTNIRTIVATGENLKKENELFDAAILVDVIEHLNSPEIVLQKVRQSLKKGGWLYLSTPNKCSPVNALFDPHYSLPIVALLNKNLVKKIMGNILRLRHKNKSDYPELFSFPRLNRVLKESGFAWQFVNREVVAFALQHPESIWNRNWHIKFVKFLRRRFGIEKSLIKVVNDRPGVFNRWINPTWFIFARRL
jgi:2-polyprenyl-3-methyl-5-hydroxy-6-metoxy-1,4-benzoquinol methylase